LIVVILVARKPARRLRRQLHRRLHLLLRHRAGADLAYFVLFLPMVLVLVFLPQGCSDGAAVSRQQSLSAQVVAVGVCALVLLAVPGSSATSYINMATQVRSRAVRAVDQLMLGYGGMVSLGMPAISHCRLRLHPAHDRGLRPLTAAILAVALSTVARLSSACSRCARPASASS